MRLISIILRMTMVAYVEKARKTSLSIMCTTSAIFIQIVVGSTNRKQKVNIHIWLKPKDLTVTHMQNSHKSNTGYYDRNCIWALLLLPLLTNLVNFYQLRGVKNQLPYSKTAASLNWIFQYLVSTTKPSFKRAIHWVFFTESEQKSPPPTKNSYRNYFFNSIESF